MEISRLYLIRTVMRNLFPWVSHQENINNRNSWVRGGLFPEEYSGKQTEKGSSWLAPEVECLPGGDGGWPASMRWRSDDHSSRQPSSSPNHQISPFHSIHLLFCCPLSSPSAVTYLIRRTLRSSPLGNALMLFAVIEGIRGT